MRCCGGAQIGIRAAHLQPDGGARALLLRPRCGCSNDLLSSMRALSLKPLNRFQRSPIDTSQLAPPRS